jgi:hypothetical protein
MSFSEVIATIFSAILLGFLFWATMGSRRRGSRHVGTNSISSFSAAKMALSIWDAGAGST